MTTTALDKTNANGNSMVGNVAIDYEAVLRQLNLDPKNPAVQALVLTCREYELDPVLKHMVLIQGTPYVTHKGLWHIGHRSGLLDGEEIVAAGETDKEWWATVAIYRKDWSRPITMTGRYGKGATNKNYGPEMAVTRAECLVLRRMFDVAAPVQEEIDWNTAPPPNRAPAPKPRQLPDPRVDVETGEIIEPAPAEVVKEKVAEARSAIRRAPGRKSPAPDGQEKADGEEATAQQTRSVEPAPAAGDEPAAKPGTKKFPPAVDKLRADVAALPKDSQAELREWLDKQGFPHKGTELTDEQLPQVVAFVRELTREAEAIAAEMRV